MVISTEGLTGGDRACARGYVEVAKVLLERGAATEIRDDQHFTPFLYAAAAGRASLHLLPVCTHSHLQTWTALNYLSKKVPTSK